MPRSTHPRSKPSSTTGEAKRTRSGVTVTIRAPGHGDIHLASGVDNRAITAYRPDHSEVEHTETPMPTDGTFPIAYITRTFVAAAALQLVDEGRIGLDEPVTKWLPESPTSDKVTPSRAARLHLRAGRVGR